MIGFPRFQVKCLFLFLIAELLPNIFFSLLFILFYFTVCQFLSASRTMEILFSLLLFSYFVMFVLLFPTFVLMFLFLDLAEDYLVPFPAPHSSQSLSA